MSDLPSAESAAGVPFSFTSTLPGKILLAISLLLAVISLVIVGIRVDSVIRYGKLFSTSGTEGSNIYAVWKVQNGAPLFEWPDRAPYAFTPYNFLFYQADAAINTLFSSNDAQIMVTDRLFTVFAACIGAFLQYRIMLQLLRLPRAQPSVKLFLFSIAIVAWLSTGFTSWWAITVRPDIPAVALALAGLLLYIAGTRRSSVMLLIAASLMFFFAWGFRQVTVWTLAGLGVHVLLFRRNLKEIVAFLAPAAILMAIALAVGGPVLRYNIIFAQSINWISIPQSFQLGALAVIPNAFFWLFPLTAALLPVKLPSAPKGLLKNPLFAGLSPVVVVAIVAFVMGFIALGREGATRNHIAEAFFACAILTGVLTVRIFTTCKTAATRFLPLAANLLFLSSFALVLLQVVRPNRYGKLRLEPDEFRARQETQSVLAALPKPLWTQDEVFEMPWNSTDGKYPAISLIGAYYDTARERRLLKDSGIEGMIQSHRFKSLFLHPDTPDDKHYYNVALAAGYYPMPVPDHPALAGMILLPLEPPAATTIPATNSNR